MIKHYNKYRNVKTVVDGIKFDSKAESEYYIHLKKLVQQNKIKCFERQKRIILQDGYKLEGYKKQREISYVVDFVVHNLDGTIGYIDVKGARTKEFNIKKKLFEYKLKEPLQIVKKGRYEWQYDN